jgi:hypothetical protein
VRLTEPFDCGLTHTQLTQSFASCDAKLSVCVKDGVEWATGMRTRLQLRKLLCDMLTQVGGDEDIYLLFCFVSFVFRLFFIFNRQAQKFPYRLDLLKPHIAQSIVRTLLSLLLLLKQTKLTSSLCFPGRLAKTSSPDTKRLSAYLY